MLPLDPRAEVHTRADRATLELRRVLADLVATVQGAPLVTAVTVVDHPVLAHRVAQLRDRAHR